MLAEQVLDERIESAENSVAFTRILDRHNALTDDVTRTQIEFAASLVAEVHKILTGKILMRHATSGSVWATIMM